MSDQVVAPVRETCAQVMGAVMKQMPPPLVHETLSILLQMQVRCDTEAYMMGSVGGRDDAGQFLSLRLYCYRFSCFFFEEKIDKLCYIKHYGWFFFAYLSRF